MHGFHRAKCSAASEFMSTWSSGGRVPLKLVTLTPALGGVKPIRSFAMRSTYRGEIFWRSVALSHSTHRVRQQKANATRRSKQSSFLAHCSGPCTLKLFPPTQIFPSVPVSKHPPASSVAPALITCAGLAQVKEHILANKVVSNSGEGWGALRHWREQNTMEHR